MDAIASNEIDRKTDKPFAYDVIHYRGAPFDQTHPRRLATLAMLHGMKPAPPAACHVFELGCGDGGNLIPMACQYPNSTFLGIDLGASAIEIGRGQIAELGLKNIELRPLDIADVTPELGQFDYIISHGVYSWVPEVVRAKMLSIFRANLSPQGIAYVSYNCHPGSYLRDLARSIMLFHVRGTVDPRQRVQQARALLRVISEISNDQQIYGMVLRSQHQRVSDTDDVVFYHDDLDADAQAFFLYQVVEAAARDGLQYVSDSRTPLLTDSLLEVQGDDAVVNFLKQIPAAERIGREQYLDLVGGRMFRSTLLCHHEITLDRPIAPNHIKNFQISSELRPASVGLDPKKPGSAAFKTIEGQEIRVDHGLGKAALLHLGEIWPHAISFADLVTAVLARLGPELNLTQSQLAEEVASLTTVLLRCFYAGAVELEAYPPQLTVTGSERPLGSFFAQNQIARGPLLTNLRHSLVLLEENPLAEHLFRLLDGTRTIDQLGEAMRIWNAKRNAELNVNEPDITREAVVGALRMLGRLALLVG